MTIDPPVRNKEQFDEAVNKYAEYEIEYISFEDDRLKDLDEYIDSRNPLRYDFDGVIISKLKVQRIFYIHNKLLQNIFYVIRVELYIIIIVFNQYFQTGKCVLVIIR